MTQSTPLTQKPRIPHIPVVAQKTSPKSKETVSFDDRYNSDKNNVATEKQTRIKAETHQGNRKQESKSKVSPNKHIWRRSRQ